MGIVGVCIIILMLKRKLRREHSLQQQAFRDNIIQGTRHIIRKMTPQQKLQKARAHIIDALHFKRARYESESLQTPKLFKFVYWFQLSSVWGWLLFLCGYFYLGLTALDNENYGLKIGLQSFCLLLFWIDMVMGIYLYKFDRLEEETKYDKFFTSKFTLILLMTIDLFIFSFLPCFNSRPIRPFRILRAFIPLYYDSEYRKNLKAFASSYIDIVSFIVFYTIIIVAFGIIGNQLIQTNGSVEGGVDPYKNNYNDLGKMIFIVYITASYDVFPDNQLLAMQHSQPNYLFFVIFAFANMFLFSSIPGELIYIKFVDTRSKILLAEDIQQQQSLILAFVTLAENESNLSISKLIKFLLFLYRYKIRYIEYITNICLKLDNNNNRSIQVNEFMQLTKILVENEVLLPPKYDDIKLWLRLRRFLGKRLGLKSFVKSWIFEFIASIVVSLAFINSIYFLYYYTPLSQIFDTVFVWLFLLELIVRIIGLGPQNFFMDKWNRFDTYLILLGCLLVFVDTNNNVDGILRMVRVFKLTSFFNLLFTHKRMEFQVLRRVKRLFEMTFEIMPIIVKFLFLFLFFFHIFAILGMEIFYNFYGTDGMAQYKQYQQYSNWRNYVMAQYNNIAILYEAGWSTMANNHIVRAPHYYAHIMLFCCLMHIIYVFILMNLIKGIFWEVYITVDTIFMEREQQAARENKKEQDNTEKTKEINEINKAIENFEFIEPDTVIKRTIAENQFDQQIAKKLKNAFLKPPTMMKSSKSRRMKKSVMTHKIISDWEIDITEMDVSSQAKSQYRRRSFDDENLQLPPLRQKRKISINEIEQIDEQDFQDEFSQLLERIIVNPKIKYHQYVASPRLFVDYLKHKFIHPEQLIVQNEFKLSHHPLHNKESMFFHIYEMRSFLNLETSKRQQKAMIINSLMNETIITEEQGQVLIKKRLIEKKFRVDNDGVLRKVFMADINEDLINKFQVEFFSYLYGSSFKRINKITLEPLLQFEAGLVYTFRNILRYPQMSRRDFFEILTCIQDKISNNLLQKGSLFKLIYKLEHEADMWFSIEYKRQSEIKIRFLKSGLWCYHQEMPERKTLYSRDVFNWSMPEEDRQICEKYVKRFYQGFEGFALSLLDSSKFFQSNPQTHIYDLYVHHFNTEQVTRIKKQRLQVSKIMLVVLCKEDERADVGMKNLDYELTSMRVKNQPKKKIDVRFESDDTFEQMKHLIVEDVEKIVDSEGLPFSYILNLIKELSDTIAVSAENLLLQVESALIEKIDEIKQGNENNNTDNREVPMVSSFNLDSFK